MNNDNYYLTKEINFDAIKKRKNIKKTYFDPFNSIFVKRKITPINNNECENTNNVYNIKKEVKDDVKKINTKEIIEETNIEILPNISSKNSI